MRLTNPARNCLSFGMLPEWVNNVVTIDTFFSPCARCCGEACKSSPRDRQANFFVVNSRRRDLTACSHCKPKLESEGAVLIQIRRSSHHDVVKIQELQRLCPQAVQGVQSYTINGQKVAFIRTRAVPKEARGSPSCVSCHRSLQDNSTFCSLECKKRKLTSPFSSPSYSDVSSDASPAFGLPNEWGTFKMIHSYVSCSSAENMNNARKRRKSMPRRSPLE